MERAFVRTHRRAVYIKSLKKEPAAASKSGRAASQVLWERVRSGVEELGEAVGVGRLGHRGGGASSS